MEQHVAFYLLSAVVNRTTGETERDRVPETVDMENKKRIRERDEAGGVSASQPAVRLLCVRGVSSEQKQLSRESPVCLPSQDHLDKAIELKPQDPLSYYMLGRWCYAVGDLCTTHTLHPGLFSLTTKHLGSSFPTA